MASTWTYVVASDPYNGWAKIGTTMQARGSRLAELQTANPLRLRDIASWEVAFYGAGEQFYDCEKELHEHFAPLRGLGEWFALPASLLMEMKGGRFRTTADLMYAWPASRIVELAVSEDVSPAVLAEQFAAPVSSHRLATSILRSVPNAG
jgi:Meiotically up-regulated gene 113